MEGRIIIKIGMEELGKLKKKEKGRKMRKIRRKGTEGKILGKSSKRMRSKSL